MMVWYNLDESTSAAEVPGGCLVRHLKFSTTTGWMPSLAFVPNVVLNGTKDNLIFSAPSERAPGLPSQMDY